MAAVSSSPRILQYSVTMMKKELFTKASSRMRIHFFQTQRYKHRTNRKIQSLTTSVNEEIVVRSPYEDVCLSMVSFPEYMFRKLDEFSDLVLKVDYTTGRQFTGRQLKAYSIKVASGLTKLGLKKGDKLLIFTNNCLEYPILFMACSILGVIICPTNPTLTHAELARQIINSESTSIVTMPHLMPTVIKSIDSSKDVANRIKFKFCLGEYHGTIPFSSLMEDDGKAYPENIDINSKKDILLLLYSSGTTGLPKCVMMSHYTIVNNLEQIIRGPMRCFSAGEECLIGVVPFYHGYGLLIVLVGSLCSGSKLVTLPRFEPEQFLRAIERYKISYMHLAPPLALFLAKSPLVKNYDIRSVKNMVLSAAPVGAELTQNLIDKLGVNVLQAYGLTEALLCSMDRIPSKISTVGQLLPNIIGKVVDIDTGKTLGPGEDGEIILKGPQFMLGYLNNQSATDEIIRNGWIHTGDIGNFDEDGYLIISDRLKDFIKYKGFQVSPAELEDVICSHSAVCDAAVVGIKSGEEVGEVPKAYVVPKQNARISEQDIIQFVEANVAPYKRLRGGVQMVDTIPKSASGKILRKDLKNRL